MRVYQSYTQGVGVQIKGGIIVTLANPITGVLLVYTSSYYSKATPSVHIVLIIMRQLALALQSPFFLLHCWLLTLSVHAQQGLLYLFCLSVTQSLALHAMRRPFSDTSSYSAIRGHEFNMEFFLK